MRTIEFKEMPDPLDPEQSNIVVLLKDDDKVVHQAIPGYHANLRSLIVDWVDHGIFSRSTLDR